ncbi:MAG: hypothetical protein AAGA58_17465 [Verrucomicrobiota bacterium]
MRFWLCIITTGIVLGLVVAYFGVFISDGIYVVVAVLSPILAAAVFSPLFALTQLLLDPSYISMIALHAFAFLAIKFYISWPAGFGAAFTVSKIISARRSHIFALRTERMSLLNESKLAERKQNADSELVPKGSKTIRKLKIPRSPKSLLL